MPSQHFALSGAQCEQQRSLSGCITGWEQTSISFGLLLLIEISQLSSVWYTLHHGYAAQRVSTISSISTSRKRAIKSVRCSILLALLLIVDADEDDTVTLCDLVSGLCVLLTKHSLLLMGAPKQHYHHTLLAYFENEDKRQAMLSTHPTVELLTVLLSYHAKRDWQGDVNWKWRRKVATLTVSADTLFLVQKVVDSRLSGPITCRTWWLCFALSFSSSGGTCRLSGYYFRLLDLSMPTKHTTLLLS